MDRTLHPPQPTASFRDEEPVAFDLVEKTAISGPRFFSENWALAGHPTTGKREVFPNSRVQNPTGSRLTSSRCRRFVFLGVAFWVKVGGWVKVFPPSRVIKLYLFYHGGIKLDANRWKFYMNIAPKN